MAPAKFDDLEKSCADLFGKGFDFGAVKFECKTKADGVDMVLKGDHANSTGLIKGSLESNFSCHGVAIKKTWHTANSCDLEISKSGLAKNCGKTVLTGTFSPDGGFVPGKFKQNISCPSSNVNISSTLSAAPKIALDASFAHKQFLFGLSTGYDVSKSALTGHKIGLGMTHGAISTVVKSSLANDVNISVFNKLNDKQVLGVQASYGSAVSMGVAMKCNDCNGATVQVKLDNNGHLGYSYNTKLSACNLTFSSKIDLTNLQGGGHKLGTSMKFDL